MTSSLAACCFLNNTSKKMQFRMGTVETKHQLSPKAAHTILHWDKHTWN